MGAVLFISLGLMMLMGLPTLTYFYARHLGRNHWRWFIIGMILPGLATIILSFLKDLSEEDKTEKNQP